MAKRLKLKCIRPARTYTFEEAAYALGVSIGTVRAWRLPSRAHRLHRSEPAEPPP